MTSPAETAVLKAILDLGVLLLSGVVALDQRRRARMVPLAVEVQP